MKIAKIKTDNLVIQQVEKVFEEEKEFQDEVERWSFCNGTNKAELLSEYFDCITSKHNLLIKLGITEEEIRSHMKLHYQKLEQRHEEGRINIDEWSEY